MSSSTTEQKIILPYGIIQPLDSCGKSSTMCRGTSLKRFWHLCQKASIEAMKSDRYTAVISVVNTMLRAKVP